MRCVLDAGAGISSRRDEHLDGNSAVLRAQDRREPKLPGTSRRGLPGNHCKMPAWSPLRRIAQLPQYPLHVSANAHAVRRIAREQPTARVGRQVREPSLHDIDRNACARCILPGRRHRARVLIGRLDAHCEGPFLLARIRDQVFPLPRREPGPFLESKPAPGARRMAIRAASMAMVPEPQSGSQQGSSPLKPAARIIGQITQLPSPLV